jgi:hypothetical protein
VLEATTFRSRFIGLRPNATNGLLLRARSVHTAGMEHPLGVVGLDRHFVVVGVRTVVARRVVVMASARWILELPPDRPLPKVGETLTKC